MNKIFTLSLCFILFAISAFGNGVAIVDAANGTYFPLLESHVEVTVNNQIATTKVRHVFNNPNSSAAEITYGFPLSAGASTTNIRWLTNGVWTTASLIAAPQDTVLSTDSLGNSIMDNDLRTYLGASPLLFKLTDSISGNQQVTVELTYVELLPYNNNIVSYTHTNNYGLIQTTPLNNMTFDFNVVSTRDIISIDLLSHTGTSSANYTNQANLSWSSNNTAADTDYMLEYELDAGQLGLVSFSTFLPNALNPCDSTNNGYFAMIVEPDGTDSTQVISKVFTLIIDVSGSMNGDKITQARDAASFIVSNMNFGDKFNIVEFSTNASSWQPNHVDFNASNEAAALTYISSLNSGGGTKFNNAFNTAIPQFTYDTTVANIIIFLTDGRAGESDTAILSNLSNLVTSNNLTDNIEIHTFGIGNNINQSLLSIIATQYNGLASFVGDNDLATTLSTFYSNIRNPVLLNVQASFSPSTVIQDIYPLPLPNLYKGQQMIVVGRYSTPGNIQATFSGQSFGTPASFQYNFTLTDSLIQEHQFLVKIWAKLKIDNLMNQYYIANDTSFLADSLEAEVTDLSLCYGVVSPFTSFLGVENTGSGNSPGGFLSNGSNGSNGNNNPSFEDNDSRSNQLVTAWAYPNPFKAQVNLSFVYPNINNSVAIIKIYDGSGRLIRIIESNLSPTSSHTISWDGRSNDGTEVEPGGYFYQIEIDDVSKYRGTLIKL